LHRELAFRGHDEFSDSSDKRNFLDVINDYNDVINEVLQKTPKNN